MMYPQELRQNSQHGVNHSKTMSLLDFEQFVKNLINFSDKGLCMILYNQCEKIYTHDVQI